MFEPSSRSHTVFSDVKTGAITTSQWFAFATNGFNASAVSTDWLTVLYIFQFPAITGLRIINMALLRSAFLFSGQAINIVLLAEHGKVKAILQYGGALSLVRQRFDAG